MHRQFSHVVVFETASNQRTIFATNRLRENIGASQQIHDACVTFVDDAVGRYRADYDVVVQSSGKAIVLAVSEPAARALVTKVTRRTLLESPGVVQRGAIAPLKEWSAASIEKAIQEAHHRLTVLASRLPSPAFRFPGLPFVEPCASSGLPARSLNVRAAGGKTPATSDVILHRRTAALLYSARLRIGSAVPGVAMYSNITTNDVEAHETGEDDIGVFGDWVAIIHADGNGLGRVFMSFLEYLPANVSADEYVKTLHDFSRAVDDWSRAAVNAAVHATWADDIAAQATPQNGSVNYRPFVPVVPVVLGGDDLTVLCEGRRAVRFTAEYLAAFETQSKDGLAGALGQRIPGLAREGHVAAAAGVAIVKPHFPFHRAYELADALGHSAKAAKEQVKVGNSSVPCSALDFQVVFDTSGTSLDDIRGGMTGRTGETLTMRPYVVTPLGQLARADTGGKAWAGRRQYRSTSAAEPTLLGAVDALLKVSNDRAAGDVLPRTQVYALQAALREGREIAAGRLAQIRPRYPKFPWTSIAYATGENLFVDDGAQYGTCLLDALELADLGGSDALH